MNNVAIITARGGSKRIPRKNIKKFIGKPIIAYSIEAAINSGIFTEVMVSTDDEEIAKIAIELGAKVPFYRSIENSDDYSSTADVLIEVLEEYNNMGLKFENACCIYPTAPFITSSKLNEAFTILIDSNADTILPITSFSFPIWRSFKLEDNKVSYNWQEYAPKRSQDLPPAYHDCGQFYFFNIERFLSTKKLITNNTKAIIVPEYEVQDIDTLEDWKLAEIKYQLMLNNDV